MRVHPSDRRCRRCWHTRGEHLTAANWLCMSCGPARARHLFKPVRWWLPKRRPS